MVAVVVAVGLYCGAGCVCVGWVAWVAWIAWVVAISVDGVGVDAAIRVGGGVGGVGDGAIDLGEDAFWALDSASQVAAAVIVFLIFKIDLVNF